MEMKYIILGLSLPVGILFSLLGGLMLAVIFVLLWIDKIIIEAVKIPRYLGIEFATVSMIVIGIVHGYLIGFLFALIVIPILEGIRQLFIPSNDEWPPFVPSPSHAADGVVALIAFVLKNNPLFIIFIVGLLVKYAINIFKDTVILGKPPDILTPIPNFVFNMILVLTMTSLIEILMALNGA